MAGFDPLSPWDAAPHFQTIVQRQVPVLAGTNQLIEADPQRVLLVISNTTGSTILVGPSPETSTSNGLPVLSASQPLLINDSWWGPLCQAQWFYASTIMGGNMTVIALSLKDWPKGETNDARQIPTDEIPNVSPRTQRFVNRNRRPQP